MNDERMQRFAISINEEALVVLFAFALSLINSIMLSLSTVVLLGYFFIKNPIVAAATKGLIFLSIRSIINTGLAPSYDSISGLFKWFLLLSLAGVIILSTSRMHENNNRRFIILLFVLFFYIVLDSILYSGYPVASIFKAFAWIFVFYSVLLAVVKHAEIDWIKLLTNYLNAIIIASPIALIYGVAYLRNGYAFQGITNHPNMLGVVSALAFAVNAHMLQQKMHNGRIVMLVLSTFACIASGSRTGLLCIVLCLIIFIWFSAIPFRVKIGLMILTLIAGIVALSQGAGDMFLNFLYKGRSSGDFLYSREGQIERAINKYNHNKWFGSGFMVPYYESKSYELFIELTVEPGNIVLTLLGDIGIIGTLLFCFTYTSLFQKMDKKNIIIFSIPFLASMGEMMFFSTNNLAIVYYVLFGVCFASSHTTQTIDAQKGTNSEYT